MKPCPINRRDFLIAAGALAAAPSFASAAPLITSAEVARIDRARILAAADRYLSEPPITVTAASSPRSHGGPHDYFSEGDYWWPDPKNPSGPYIRRDGYSNPANFNAHREALIRLSLIVPALTAAWLVTRDLRYARHAAFHLGAWFLTPSTHMNPSLDYAQAIQGITPGRGTGIIDTLHLIEVSRAIRLLERAHVFTDAEFASLRSWFAEYLSWMCSSKNGKEEEAATNNHGTCWVAQAAAFAAFTGNAEVLVLCRDRFRSHLLPDQLAPDGRLPLELARTKPYSYSLFNLDMLALVCQLASVESPASDNLWNFSLPDGRTFRRAVDYYLPYIADKQKWLFAHDVEYFDDLPNRQPSLLFAGLAYREPRYIGLWRKLPPDPKTAEIVRNFPIRQPLLWLTPPPRASA
ncbi:MAG: alginate lyase family protein [Terracidiphilus sp.]|nr:alginate lyase family protein [Terracidiphilus sp.]